jgi:hypothetical protein
MVLIEPQEGEGNGMAKAGEAVRAAVLVVPSKIELRTFPRPRIGPDDALLQIIAVEAVAPRLLRWSPTGTHSTLPTMRSISSPGCTRNGEARCGWYAPEPLSSPGERIGLRKVLGTDRSNQARANALGET